MQLVDSYDLMNAEYLTERGKAIIHLLARDTNKQLKDFTVANYPPHFWVKDEASSELDILNRPIRRVDVQHPSDVPKVRKEYDYHDEGHIKFPWRYLIDKGIRCGFRNDNGTIVPTEDLGIVPKTLFLDLEVETPPEIMARPINPKWPIVSFQFSENYSGDITLFMLNTELEGAEIPILQELANCKKAITRTVKFQLKPYGGKLEDIVVNPRVFLYDDERAMIRDATVWVANQHYDAYSGYNSNLFDMPYWIRRGQYIHHINMNLLSPFRRVQCEQKKEQLTGRLRLDPYVKGVQLMDYYEMYKKWSGGRQPIVKGRPFGLTYDFHLVMEYEVGFFYTDLGDKVAESRTKNPIAWFEYCTGDAFALRILEERKMILAYFDKLRRLVGVPLEYSLHNSKLIETRLLRIRDRPLPTKRPYEKKRVTGAIVLLPKSGIHEYVVIIDVKSLYPMLIIVYNLSPETVDPQGEITVGPMEDGTVLRFKKSPKGLFPKGVTFDMEEREKYRELLKKISVNDTKYEDWKILETLHKFLACSYYGVTGYPGFILYNDSVRKAITFLGREALLLCKKDLERSGYKVEYGDTDSLFIKLFGTHPREGFIVEGQVNQTLRRIAWKHGSRFTLESKYEHFCKRIIFVPKIQKRKGRIEAAKKRYAYIDEHDVLHVVGLAPRRSGTPAVVRQHMMIWLDKVLREMDIQGSIKLIRNLWEQLPTYPLNVVGVPRGVHKDAYEARNPWRTGMDYMQARYGKIFREDKKPLLLYMDLKRMYGRGFSAKDSSYAVCITERDTTLPADISEFIDWSKMKQKVVTAHFKPLFEAIGISWDEVLKKHRQVNMDAFTKM